jgi:hypothetical protein
VGVAVVRTQVSVTQKGVRENTVTPKITAQKAETPGGHSK